MVRPSIDLDGERAEYYPLVKLLPQIIPIRAKWAKLKGLFSQISIDLSLLKAVIHSELAQERIKEYYSINTEFFGCSAEESTQKKFFYPY